MLAELMATSSRWQSTSESAPLTFMSGHSPRTAITVMMFGMTFVRSSGSALSWATEMIFLRFEVNLPMH